MLKKILLLLLVCFKFCFSQSQDTLFVLFDEKINTQTRISTNGLCKTDVATKLCYVMESYHFTANVKSSQTKVSAYSFVFSSLRITDSLLYATTLGQQNQELLNRQLRLYNSIKNKESARAIHVLKNIENLQLQISPAPDLYIYEGDSAFLKKSINLSDILSEESMQNLKKRMKSSVIYLISRTESCGSLWLAKRVRTVQLAPLTGNKYQF